MQKGDKIVNIWIIQKLWRNIWPSSSSFLAIVFFMFLSNPHTNIWSYCDTLYKCTCDHIPTKKGGKYKNAFLCTQVQNISYTSPQCFLVLQTMEMIKVQYLPIVFFLAGKLLNTAIEKNGYYIVMSKKSSEAAFSQFSCRVSSQLKICKTN